MNNDSIDCLLDHLYQKSISEVVLLIMKIEEGNFTDALATTIKKRKISVITKLVNKLVSDTDDEECLNATAILTELIEVADFFNIINRKDTIQRLSVIAFDDETGISYSR
jgi:hypothetical protein